jgi:uncharacterized membrane protein (UPF0127 family)
MQSNVPRRATGLCASLAALLWLALAAGCSSDSSPRVHVQTDSGEVGVRVEIVHTPEARQRGLMWRDQLAEDAGMLFVFPETRPLSFWMRNTPLPLDIIYITEDAEILRIARSTRPYSDRPIPSGGPARYVLEVNAGFAARHGLAEGDAVRLPPLPPAR